MMYSEKDLERFMSLKESENIEFKEAKRGFQKRDLFRYCVALSNEGGGRLILGVTDESPRRVVGSLAFSDLGAIRAAVYDALRFDIQAQELSFRGKRVVIIDIPGRPVGIPREYDGMYLCRRGASLVSMPPDRLSSIFRECENDFSSVIHHQASLDDLDCEAIQVFRTLWAKHKEDPSLLGVSDVQLLDDAELLVDGAVTNAALILLAKPKSLSRLIPDAEVIFEYRSSQGSIDHQQRLSFREGLFLFMDRLWDAVRLRIETRAYQIGLVRREIPAFREDVFREGLLNAVCHRDYRRTESVFVRQYPDRIDIDSPGGLPCGLTVETLLFKRSWRNRRIAEALEKADLVERSGQGVDRMWRSSILDGKLPPDYSRTDDHHVGLTLHGNVADEDLLRFLEQVGERDAAQFGAYDIAALHYVSNDKKMPGNLKEHADRLVHAGIVERVGRKYILARKYYAMKGQPGAHTRQVGLDRETNLALVLKHIRGSKARGCVLSELQQVLPAQSPKYIQGLLATLKDRGKILVRGRTRAARWYPAERG